MNEGFPHGLSGRNVNLIPWRGHEGHFVAIAQRFNAGFREKTRSSSPAGTTELLQIPWMKFAEPLSHVIPAVHVQNMPGDVAGHWGGEEKCGVDDFVRVAQPA